MKLVPRRHALGISVALLSPGLSAETPFPRIRDEEERDIRLPSGKSQREEILKADHERNLVDAAQLTEMAGQLKQELEKNDFHVLSVSSLKKTEEIEKLAKRIRSRLRRY